jgi:hypothetical protein
MKTNLWIKYEQEHKKYSHYIKSHPKSADKQVKWCVKLIEKIDCENVAVELCNTNSLKFTLLLTNHLVMITKPFESEVFNEVVFTIFKRKSRELLVCDITDLPILVEGLIELEEKEKSGH